MLAALCELFPWKIRNRTPPCSPLFPAYAPEVPLVPALPKLALIGAPLWNDHRLVFAEYQPFTKSGVTMTTGKQSRPWQQVAEQVCKETDPEKVQGLVDELIESIDHRKGQQAGEQKRTA